MTGRATATPPGPALLAGFLTKHHLSAKAAAEALRVTRITIWNWTNGHTIPSETVQEDIALWTNGEVPAGAPTWGEKYDPRSGKGEVKPFEPGEDESEPAAEPSPGKSGATKSGAAA